MDIIEKRPPLPTTSLRDLSSRLDRVGEAARQKAVILCAVDRLQADLAAREPTPGIERLLDETRAISTVLQGELDAIERAPWDPC